MRALGTWLLVAVVFATQSAAAGLERKSFRQDGLRRSYLEYVPDTPAPASGRPLVLVLHGGGGTARGIVREAGGGFHAFAEATGAVIVYPDAVGRMWDFGEGAASELLSPRRDDLAYFRSVIARVLDQHQGDSARIFATGISRGGQASYFLACKLPGRIRAIAPVAMPLPDFLEDDCRAAPGVGIAVINGTADPIVPYEGGPIVVRRKTRGDVLSTEATLALFRSRNGCSGGSEAWRIGQVVRREWAGCRLPTVLYRVEGGGHTWPSGTQYLPRRLVGPVSRDIDASAEIAAFFAQFL
jgi:polyhydroxybutyrate depolymerase